MVTILPSHQPACTCLQAQLLRHNRALTSVIESCKRNTYVPNNLDICERFDCIGILSYPNYTIISIIGYGRSDISSGYCCLKTSRMVGNARFHLQTAIPSSSIYCPVTQHTLGSQPARISHSLFAAAHYEVVC